MWPDIFHRINRRVAQALNHPSCEEVKHLLKQAMKLFRFSRAPFATGRFGQMISEARRDLLQAVVAGKVDDLVDMWLSGVARDRGVADDSFGKHDLIQLLQSCARALTKSMAISFPSTFSASRSCNLAGFYPLLACFPGKALTG